MSLPKAPDAPSAPSAPREPSASPAPPAGSAAGDPSASPSPSPTTALSPSDRPSAPASPRGAPAPTDAAKAAGRRPTRPPTASDTSAIIAFARGRAETSLTVLFDATPDGTRKLTVVVSWPAEQLAPVDAITAAALHRQVADLAGIIETVLGSEVVAGPAP